MYEISFTGAKSGFQQALLPPEILAENSFSFLFQLLELHSLHSLDLASSSLPKASSLVSCFSPHIAFASVVFRFFSDSLLEGSL